jgi:hypothetical protein
MHSSATITALQVRAVRLSDAGLREQANSLVYTRMRNLRDVITWHAQIVRVANRPRRPGTHAAQGLTFQAAVCGVRPVPTAPEPEEVNDRVHFGRYSRFA